MEQNNTLSIKSDKLTLSAIVECNLRFNIPIYQRLYVWSEEQVKTLMGDLYNAFLQKADKFYLGGIMLSKNNDMYDLVDGQQRFTTLWLLSKLLKGELSRFTYSKKNKIDISRINFSVRDFANRYFNSNGTPLNLTDDEKEELIQIDDAKNIIEKYLIEEIQNKEDFSSFIFNNALFIATELPPETDENKVFEAMNNRGIQLQQHEILKTRLLKSIKNNSLRNKYSLLWDACSIMDNYLERNIKVVANLQWKELFSMTDEEEEIVELPDDILDRITKSDNDNIVSLTDILNQDISEEDTKLIAGVSQKRIKEDEYDAGKVRSITTFPMLLLHTLRIYEYRYVKLKDAEHSAEVKGKELIRIFQDKDYFKDQADVEKFIMLLWNIRKQFDRFVIKWVSNEDDADENHLIKRLYQNKTSFQRRAIATNEGFALLQSMLYHSQQIITLYWLTPFLNKLLDVQDSSKLHIYLEMLDNYMFCNPKQDLREMSYKAMMNNNEDLKGDVYYVDNELMSHKGRGYPSYWFYKLEYILWKNRSKLDKVNEWEDYRITAKNSIEHISPINPKSEDINIVFSPFDSEEEKDRKKNDFGNLVLITSVMNSEYNHKTFLVKKQEFRDKLRLDSLKSDLIFDNENWNWELCEKHRNHMIELFENYIIRSES